jgi:hypothetical protein
MKHIKNWKASKRVDGKGSRSNGERAACAGSAVTAYFVAKEGRPVAYDELSSCLGDMLADLYHYAASEGIEPERIAALAQLHFDSER